MLFVNALEDLPTLDSLLPVHCGGGRLPIGQWHHEDPVEKEDVNEEEGEEDKREGEKETERNL